MTTQKSTKLLAFLNSMTDDELYETGKIVTHLVGLRHSMRVMQGKEIRPGKRGVPWRKRKS